MCHHTGDVTPCKWHSGRPYSMGVLLSGGLTPNQMVMELSFLMCTPTFILIHGTQTGAGLGAGGSSVSCCLWTPKALSSAWGPLFWDRPSDQAEGGMSARGGRDGGS